MPDRTVIVPLVLALIASAQIITATRGTLTPWKGGGFGMFSTMDGPGNRFIAVTATGADTQEHRVTVPFGRFGEPEELSNTFVSRLAAAPSHDAMRRLAQAVARAHLVMRDGGARPISTRLALSPYGALFEGPAATRPGLELLRPRRADGSVPITDVRVGVSRLRFDRPGLIARLEPMLADVVVRAEHGGAR